MRQQLSLFPELCKPDLKVLEPCLDEDDDRVRLDPEYEKTLGPDLKYHPEVYNLLDMSTSRLGDWAEHKVQCIALSLGYEVYENISCVGMADLVVKANNQLFMVDVKIGERNYGGGNKLRWVQRRAKDIRWDAGVYGVCLVPAYSGIYCRWYNKQKGSLLTPIHPPGLRDIWHPALPSSYRAAA